MDYINIHEAKSTLSRLVQAIKSGEEQEIIIARNGEPAARLVPIAPKPELVFGLGKGVISLPDDFDADNDAIERLFAGQGKH
jgi:prevent-host-death family protein